MVSVPIAPLANDGERGYLREQMRRWGSCNIDAEVTIPPYYADTGNLRRHPRLKFRVHVDYKTGDVEICDLRWVYPGDPNGPVEKFVRRKPIEIEADMDFRVTRGGP
jgi:hypothetical protein